MSVSRDEVWTLYGREYRELVIRIHCGYEYGQDNPDKYEKLQKTIVPDIPRVSRVELIHVANVYKSGGAYHLPDQPIYLRIIYIVRWREDQIEIDDATYISGRRVRLIIPQ